MAKKIALCIVANGRADASITFAISLLRMQTALMVSEEHVAADMHIVQTLDDALNALRASDSDTVGMLAVESTTGFDHQFAIRCLQHESVKVAVGAHPLPLIDWNQVSQKGVDGTTAEPPSSWGHVYNVELRQPLVTHPGTGFAAVASVRQAAAWWVRREVLDGILRRHPADTTATEYAPLALPGVGRNGLRTEGHHKFLELVQEDPETVVWADLDGKYTTTGPVEFGGCVGMRTVLR